MYRVRTCNECVYFQGLAPDKKSDNRKTTPHYCLKLNKESSMRKKACKYFKPDVGINPSQVLHLDMIEKKSNIALWVSLGSIIITLASILLGILLK